jgi:hypothetical protein
MAKVHWIVYLLSGFLMSSVSWKINYSKFVFFFYMGIVFILIGIAKLGFSSKEKTPAVKDHKYFQNQMRSQQHAAHYQNRQHQRQTLKKCQYCGNISRIHDNFCSRCGRRI